MLARLRPFLARRYPSETVNLQLIHGHAALSAEFELLRQNENAKPVSGPSVVHDDELSHPDDGRVLAAQWFTYRKRGLLAPFGVGTVDQALLAVLQAKHAFVRLFGLGHTVVIVDEIHAYDTYMSALLRRLLEWLAALGASVILLSATLPRHRRDELLRAYAAVRGAQQPDTAATPAIPYPRVTWATHHGVDARAVPHISASVPVSVEYLADPFADDGTFEEQARALAGRLAQALDGGGCGAVVVSAVRRAQRLFAVFDRVFRTLSPAERPGLDLFHARYLFEDRDAREKRTLARFGKSDTSVVFDDGTSRPVVRPRRFVLVATQVVEQSLDLDFDLMVTDFAPADLVLQRLGRLHRHAGRSRPPTLREPTLWLLFPPTLDGVPAFGRDQTAVYDEHTLLRSWLTVRDRRQIALPDDVQPIVEAVYDGCEPPAGLTPALLEAWDATSAKLAASIATANHEAEKRWIAAPTSSRQLWQLLQDAREEDEPHYHQEHQALTRLAELTVPVVLLYGSRAHPTLDAAGAKPFDLGKTPDVPLARRLLRRSVGVSDRRVVHDLVAEEPPPAWRRSALLRHHRALFLDADGLTLLGTRHTLRLDRDLGVVIDG